MEKYHDEFSALLDEAVAFHGHLCAGQIIGVRIAMLGLRRLGIADPKGKDRKRLIVFVEIDRCATDAIMTVTGCRLGRRNMKVMDYGKMAATFLDIESGRALRIVSLQTARAMAAAMYPDLSTGAAQLKAYRVLDDGDMFSVQEVAVSIPPEDLPGRPLDRESCVVCGESILDCRQIERDGRTLCRPCATEHWYYTAISSPSYPHQMKEWP